MRLKYIFFLTVLVLAAFTSCKKTPDPLPEPGNTSRADLTRDSIFLYAKQIYLWNDALPTKDAFNPKRFTSETTDFLNYERELITLAKIAKNPATGFGYEYYTKLVNGMPVEVDDSKYSYISAIADKNPVAYIPNKKSAVDLEGNGNDFGLKLGAYPQATDGENVDFYAFFVRAVYQGSPAANDGMNRSDRIYKVNDRALGQVGSMASELTFINSAINGESIKIEGVKYENGVAGSPYTITLKKTSYKSSPVYASKVFTAGAKKIGYLAYARFSKLSNPNNLNPSDINLDPVFADFAAKGVTELIVDLRYNGGGYVDAAQYLTNLIAPSSLTGKVMFSEHYNLQMQNGNAKILENQPFTINDVIQYKSNGTMQTLKDIDYSIARNTTTFQKKGSLLNISKIVFIVSGNTASASELVINSLKAYPADLTVKLVGTQTYGKPVGFFSIRLENKYDVYYSLFQTKNSLGQGDYFGGFTPDIVDTFDDPRNNFGDPKEYYTMLALNQFGVSSPITTTAQKTMSVNGKNVFVQSLKPMKPIVDGNEFIGMIETNHKLKK